MESRVNFRDGSDELPIAHSSFLIHILLFAVRCSAFLVCVIAVLALTVRSTIAATANWQQRVHYTIDATLIDSIHTLNGSLSVVYTNNSPDTLREVYFHLYANAFQPGSLMDERGRAIESRPVLDRIQKLPESEWGKYWIEEVNVNGHSSPFQITGTIMRVALNRALDPGDSITIDFPFREQIPKQVRRSGWMSAEGVQYSMSQWYPKIAEYDRDGWQNQEYVMREFYGVWGSFDITLHLPSSFTVGATGQCTNPREAKHGYNEIADGRKQGVYLPTELEGSTLWKFHAENVHDFAWVADTKYVHQWSTWKDTVTLHALCKLSVYGLWHNALRYAQHSLSTYSELYGPYAYRNFSVTMAGDGGMEYPQLIMITGYRPEQSLAGVSAHEIAHQWFYGMLGSNETREAFMDEGFTSYATTISMNRLYGDSQLLPDRETSWLDWFIPNFSNKRDNYRGYQQLASEGYEEPLVIPHDWFRDDVTAGQVYGKTQAILSMLEYTLGDSVFDRGIKNYYTQWRFRHPHLADFQKVMEETSHYDLDWFFDEWFRTTRTVDYSAGSVSSVRDGDRYKTTVRLRNKSLAVMPMDLLLHYDDGTTELATIPLDIHKNEEYHKSGVDLFFQGWDWTAPYYKGSIVTSKPVSWFEIDTSWRLQDLNWLNNYSTTLGFHWPRGHWALLKQLFIYPPIDGYYAIVRPIATYDEPSKLNLGAGIKFGMDNAFKGDGRFVYKTDPLRVEDKMAATPLWYDYLDGAFSISNPVNWLGRLSSFNVDASKLDGISTVRLGVSKIFRPTYLYLGATHSGSIYIEDQRLVNEAYPFYHQGWSTGATRVAGFIYAIDVPRGAAHFDLDAETSVFGSRSDFSRIIANYRTTVALGLFQNGFRVTAASATSGAPYERRFWIDRADNYEEQSNRLFRTITQIDRTVADKGYSFVEGGGGARGYNANATSSIDSALTGTQSIGVSYDLTIPNPIAKWGSFFSSFRPGVFADAGWVGNSTATISDIGRDLRTDAGVKIGVDILSWFPRQLRGVAQEYTAIPNVNFYFPLYENHPLDGERPIAFRWTVSIGSSF